MTFCKFNSYNISYKLDATIAAKFGRYLNMYALKNQFHRLNKPLKSI